MSASELDAVSLYYPSVGASAMHVDPSPDCQYPLPHHHRLVYLKNIVKNPNIMVGDYTYYDDLNDPENFERNVLYHFDFEGDRLIIIIGKFCSLASGVKFIMNGGNHRTDGFSAYPFSIFGNGWERAAPDAWPHKGDTVVGNDVWIGYNATMLPGITIGDGAIVGAQSVVAQNAPPYTIVGGNPARPIRQRFPAEVVAELLEIRWWDWEIRKITRHLEAICNSDLDALRAAR